MPSTGEREREMQGRNILPKVLYILSGQSELIYWYDLQNMCCLHLDLQLKVKIREFAHNQNFLGPSYCFYHHYHPWQGNVSLLKRMG